MEWSALRIRTAVAAFAMVLLMFVGLAGTASAASGGQTPVFPCANSGPASTWPAAAQTQKRTCWWGAEVFFSKNDTKILAGVAGGALSAVAEYYGKYLPKSLVLKILGAAGVGGTAAAINNAIDDGRCVKLTIWHTWLPPKPSTYRCT